MEDSHFFRPLSYLIALLSRFLVVYLFIIKAFHAGFRCCFAQYIITNHLKMRYSPYVNKGFVYISVSKILNFIRQLLVFS